MYKKTAFCLAILVGISAISHSESSRTLSETIPAAEIESISLEAGVGDIDITARSKRDKVVIAVLLTPRRGGIFSSKRQAEREVAEATLKAKVKGKVLVLSLEPKSDDRRFEEHWTLEVPARLALQLEHGVGDIKARGIEGGLNINSGVGEILVEVDDGDVVINLGVGTAVVRGPAASYSSAEGAGGVGDAKLSIRGKRIESHGFIGHSASWNGDGSYRIEVEVGVGDAVISLE